MALRVYRFKQQGPGVDLSQIEAEIDSPLTLSLADVGGLLVDILVDEAALDDLTQSLASRGFELIETDPASPASRRFLEGALGATSVPGISLTGGRYVENTFSGGKLISAITWVSTSKSKKLEDVLFIYTGARVTTIITQRFDPAGPGIGTKISEEQEFLSYNGLRATTTNVVKVL